MADTAKKGEVWLTQMNVLDPGEDAEHDKPYTVEYTAEGGRRTRVLTKKEVTEIRAFNGLPAEVIESADDENEEV